MIKFHSAFSSMVSLCLFAFPSIASAQSTSTLTDAQIAKEFSPIQCQIIKGRLDTSSSGNQGGERSASYPVTGESGLVVFAEFMNTSGGMRTADLSATLSFSDSVTPTTNSLSSLVYNFPARLSWRFSEKYSKASLSLVSPRSPIDYEMMIVWTRPSPMLSESQVKKFAFSDPAESSLHMASIGLRLSSPEGLAALVQNKNVFLENSPIHRVDVKSMCNQVAAK